MVYCGQAKKQYTIKLDKKSNVEYNDSNIMDTKNKLTPQQEAFCQAYTKRGETFSSAYKSYAVAYDFEIPLTEDNKIDYKSSQYAVCQNGGSRLLLKDAIAERVRDLLLEKLNDKEVDARLNEILLGGKDTDSIQAIKIHNELKQRITKRIDITSAGRPLQGLSDDELKELAG